MLACDTWRVITTATDIAQRAERRCARRRSGLLHRPDVAFARSKCSRHGRRGFGVAESQVRSGVAAFAEDAVVGGVITRDPLDGVSGSTTEANPYHYVNNDPLNKTDPTGLRPNDGALCADSDQDVGLGGGAFDSFKRLGRLEVAGFIPDRISHLDPTSQVGLYYGDGRSWANGPIPIDQSRFYASLDFAQGTSSIHVRHTDPVDGPCGSAWPIRFNSPSNAEWSVNLPQQNNYFTYEAEPGGEFRVRWSVVHGDRRNFAGVLPTETIRPSFDGMLSVKWLSDANLQVKYDGDCFPSVEAYLITPGGQRIAVMQMPSQGPLFGLAPVGDCHYTSTGSV